MNFAQSIAPLLACAAIAPLTAADTGRPHVLFITVDDLRPSLGCYGDQHAQSAAIDALAARGTRFHQAFCQQAVSAPSRASVLTGLRPSVSGITDLEHPVSSTVPGLPTLNGIFKSAGWRTVSIGKVYHHHDDDPSGWDERLLGIERKESFDVSLATVPGSGSDLPDAKIADAAISELNSAADAPVFLALGFLRPHLPFIAPESDRDAIDAAGLPLPSGMWPLGMPPIAANTWGELKRYRDLPRPVSFDAAMTRAYMQGYLASVRFVDRQIGRVLDHLRTRGLEHRTIIVLWGDHGYKTGEYGSWCKHTNMDIDVRIPLILAGPGIPAGAVRNQVVEALDIGPTLCGLAGIPAPMTWQGDNLIPMLADPTVAGDGVAWSQYPRAIPGAPRGTPEAMGRSVRTASWRYVRWEAADGALIAEELYDHADGPLATVNRAGDTACAAILATHRGLLTEGFPPQP